MEWSKEQAKSHEESFEMFRQRYLNGKLGNKSVEEIHGDKNRCITLIRKVTSIPVWNVRRDIKNRLPGFYHQEIPHFTLDCHRYLKGCEIKGEIICDEELKEYSKVLEEIIGSESPYKIELKGIAIGGDGLVAQIWFDYEKLIDFTERLGEKVGKEVPSMNFKWGIVKDKVPKRIANLTRFTGNEDKEKVVEYVDGNRNREIAHFSMNFVDLVLSDHYIQKRNTENLGKYLFKN